MSWLLAVSCLSKFSPSELAASQLRTGLIDQTPKWRCGGKWECSPSYDLSRVNSSALEPQSAADEGEFEERRKAAAASCEAAAQARSGVVGHAVVNSGGWCLNMSGAVELTLPRGGRYLLPRYHQFAGAPHPPLID